MIYLPTALNQFEETIDSIAAELSASDAALDYVNEVDAAGKNLAGMPYRHPIYHTSFSVLVEVRGYR